MFKHCCRRVAGWGVRGWRTVMPMAVTGVLRAGRCGSALFQRDSGDLTLRVLTRGRRGGSSPFRTARAQQTSTRTNVGLADGFTDRPFLPIGIAADLRFLHLSPGEN